MIAKLVYSWSSGNKMCFDKVALDNLLGFEVDVLLRCCGFWLLLDVHEDTEPLPYFRKGMFCHWSKLIAKVLNYHVVGSLLGTRSSLIFIFLLRWSLLRWPLIWSRWRCFLFLVSLISGDVLSFSCKQLIAKQF